MKINVEWHTINKMPKNPTMEQRVQWHVAHQKACNCREVPESVKRELDKIRKTP
jgi:hypothetical protein